MPDASRGEISQECAHSDARRQTDKPPFAQVIGRVKDDHAKILELFRQFHTTADDNRRKTVDLIFEGLETHMTLEEETLYPAITEAGLEGEQMVQEALAEHAEVKTTIEELRNLESDDDHAIDQSVEDMMQTVRLHFEAEEQDMLPLARDMGARRDQEPF